MFLKNEYLNNLYFKYLKYCFNLKQLIMSGTYRYNIIHFILLVTHTNIIFVFNK